MGIKKELRIQKKLNELETTSPQCVICGEQDGKILEKHHTQGHHEGETVILCRNCHGKVDYDKPDWDKTLLSDNRTPEIKAIAFFMGLPGILELLAVYCVKHAKVLYDFIIKKQGGLTQ